MLSLGNIFSIIFWLAVGFSVFELKVLERKTGELAVKASKSGLLSIAGYHQELTKARNFRHSSR